MFGLTELAEISLKTVWIIPLTEVQEHGVQRDTKAKKHTPTSVVGSLRPIGSRHPRAIRLYSDHVVGRVVLAFTNRYFLNHEYVISLPSCEILFFASRYWNAIYTPGLLRRDKFSKSCRYMRYIGQTRSAAKSLLTRASLF